MKFSLITATYGRTETIRCLLESLKLQNYHNFELIIVDQNSTNYIENICKEYSDFFKIIYIKNPVRGLSVSRNIGLQYVTGDVIAFPDDDCEYYPDTLQCVLNFFSVNQDIDVLLGKIVTKTGDSVIRKWPSHIKRIHKYNFFMMYSAITMFVRSASDKALFDINLGVGTIFGSYEDADYIFTLLEKNRKIVYTPEIRVSHPPLDIQSMNSQKVHSYGLGFGYFCRKNLSIPILLLFIESILFHLFHLLKEHLMLNSLGGNKRYNAIISRRVGFFHKL